MCVGMNKQQLRLQSGELIPGVLVMEHPTPAAVLGTTCSHHDGYFPSAHFIQNETHYGKEKKIIFNDYTAST